MNIPKPVMVGAGLASAAVLGGGLVAAKAAESGSPVADNPRVTMVATASALGGIFGLAGLFTGRGLAGKAAGLGIGLAAGGATGALMGASALAWDSIRR